MWAFMWEITPCCTVATPFSTATFHRLTGSSTFINSADCRHHMLRRMAFTLEAGSAICAHGTMLVRIQTISRKTVLRSLKASACFGMFLITTGRETSWLPANTTGPIAICEFHPTMYRPTAFAWAHGFPDCVHCAAARERASRQQQSRLHG